MKVYFAAPLDSEDCRAKNEEYAGRLRALGLHVYMPHEHGVGDEMVLESKKAWEEIVRELYEGDMLGLQTCDMVVAVSTKEDGHLSAGLLWEIGWATGNGKPVYLIENGHAFGYSLMVTHSVSKMFKTMDECVEFLERELTGYTIEKKEEQ